jgi:hypothetical protein
MSLRDIGGDESPLGIRDDSDMVRAANEVESALEQSSP